jgi:hypothetical protein
MSRPHWRATATLTRMEVHLSDENAAKGGADDKKCVLEARPAGQQPVAVTHHAASLDEAYLGALEKLSRLLESKVGKQHHHKGGASLKTEQVVEGIEPV